MGIKSCTKVSNRCSMRTDGQTEGQTWRSFSQFCERA